MSYIVESIDWLLRERFGLKDGLADKSKVTVSRQDGGKTIEEESHRVLILDPATGTGTFLFEVVEQIRERFEKKHQKGLWPAYVHEHLLPRLFGFELLMAPYAVAHLKLGLALSARHLPELWRHDWEYQCQPNERLNIFLTNTLEDLNKVADQLGPLSIVSREANEATAVKKHRPVLVVLGNPPYSNFGRQNRNDFILGLLEDYKRGLNERKINLDDDFIKFLRWAHDRIERTGSGIVGFITNNVYLDGLTHRRMRESLLETFDEIYVLNLHGSAKKQETAPDGTKDDNVFDIMVGVAIALFVKLPPGLRPRDAAQKRGKTAAKPNATVHHADLWGLRKHKYDWLGGHNASSTEWTTFLPDSPDFFFRPRNAKHEAEYERYWSMLAVSPVYSSRIQTKRDKIAVAMSRRDLEVIVRDFASKDADELRKKYDLPPDGSGWQIAWAKDHAKELVKKPSTFKRLLYRPFDIRWTVSDDRSGGFVARPRFEVMRHLREDNFGLVLTRQLSSEDFYHAFVSADIIDGNTISLQTKEYNYLFPLYLYPNGEAEAQGELVPHEDGRRPNLAAGFVQEFAETVGLEFIADGRGNLKKTFGPEDIFHYAYAIFNAPSYRQRYVQFLKLDFPRLPITSDALLFRRLCECGAKLVGLHTMRELGPEMVSFDVPGSNAVEQVVYVPPKAAIADKGKSTMARQSELTGEEVASTERPKLPSGPTGRVYINPKQYFEGVLPVVWEFRIGGYQVCEKWLKDHSAAKPQPNLLMCVGMASITKMEDSRWKMAVAEPRTLNLEP